jgi:hypothetical protein
MLKEELEEVDVPSTDEMFGSVEFEEKEDIREHNDRIARYNKSED